MIENSNYNGFKLTLSAVLGFWKLRVYYSENFGSLFIIFAVKNIVSLASDDLKIKISHSLNVESWL